MALVDRLLQIAQQIHDLEHTRDTEVGHVEADSLLIAALRALADQSGEDEIKNAVESIADSFERLGKWYA